MTDPEILYNVKRLFEPTVSPGQAFDCLFALRRERVTFEQALRAITATRTQRLDESDAGAHVPRPKVRPGSPATLGNEEACPDCGVARDMTHRCPNPHCASYNDKNTTTSVFKNPRLSWSQYSGKAVMDVVRIDYDFVHNIMTHFDSDFWVHQARLALIQHELETARPPSRISRLAEADQEQQ